MLAFLNFQNKQRRRRGREGDRDRDKEKKTERNRDRKRDRKKDTGRDPEKQTERDRVLTEIWKFFQCLFSASGFFFGNFMEKLFCEYKASSFAFIRM